METGLVKVDAFRQALAEAKSIPDVKNLLDQADLFRQWLKKQKAGKEAQNVGAEMKLRAERKLGEFFKPIERGEAGRPKKNTSKALTNFQKALDEAKVPRQVSHIWEAIADIPSDLFEEYITLTKDNPEGEITTNGLLRHFAKHKTSVKNVIPLPEGVFNVIYADPPWQYDNQIPSWGPTSLHYNSLPLQEISYYTDKNKREIKDCFAGDAVLFLWATNPNLEMALQLVINWGFDYKTNIVWVKTNIKRPGSGFWVRGRHELLFICGCGSFLPDQKGKAPVGSVTDWEDTLLADQQGHSRKPEAVYELIETMYPEGKYLELFSRGETRQRWTGWGDEAN